MSDTPSLPPPPPAAPDPAAGNAGGGLPWELRERYGALVGLAETVRLMLTAPVEAFARARRRGDLVSPIAYGVLVGWIGIVGQRVWAFVIGTSILDWMGPQAREASMLAFALSGLGIAAVLVLAPIFLLVGLLVWSLLLHLFLMLFGATRESPTGFEGTVRVVAWSMTAQLAQLVPFAGGLLGVVWAVVLLTLGSASMHRTTNGRALGAVLTPLALGCLLLALLFVGIVALAVGAAIHSR
jgi:hypothetical protein